MKKLLTMMLALFFVFAAFGCGSTDTADGNDKQATVTTSTEKVSTTPQNTTTTESIQTTTTTIPVEDTADDLLADGNTILGFLLEAETINSELEELINNYNNNVTSEEDTVVALGELHEELATVIANATATQWKTQRFTNYSERLATVLNNLNNYFIYAIEGLNENSEWKLTKAHSYRTSYASSSVQLARDIDRII